MNNFKSLNSSFAKSFATSIDEIENELKKEKELEQLKQNLEDLKAMRLPNGKPLNIIELPMPDAVYGLPKNDLDDCDIRRRKIVRALESKSQNCRTSPEPRCTTPALDIPTTKPSFSGDSQIF